MLNFTQPRGPSKEALGSPPRCPDKKRPHRTRSPRLDENPVFACDKARSRPCVLFLPSGQLAALSPLMQRTKPCWLTDSLGPRFSPPRGP